MYKLKPIRRRSRKIGRNEPCPCGRTKQVIVAEAPTDWKESGDGLGEVVTETCTVPIKYKHCCGKIENQRMMAAVRRHISRTIAEVMHGPKQTSKLRKIVDFFKRGKK